MTAHRSQSSLLLPAKDCEYHGTTERQQTEFPRHTVSHDPNDPLRWQLSTIKYDRRRSSRQSRQRAITAGELILYDDGPSGQSPVIKSPSSQAQQLLDRRLTTSLAHGNCCWFSLQKYIMLALGNNTRKLRIREAKKSAEKNTEKPTQSAGCYTSIYSV